MGKSEEEKTDDDYKDGAVTKNALQVITIIGEIEGHDNLPALTSPPTVFIIKSTPLISLSISISASLGSICSYLVALLVAGRLSCPSISPIIVIT